MAYIRTIVRLHRDGALPEDDAINVWHFADAVLDRSTHQARIQSALETFYSNSSGIGDKLASTLSGDVTFDYYDLSEATPRVPFANDTFNFTPGTDALPAEVSLCVSFQGTQVSGQPQARRRGRLYIGPLAVGTNLTVTGADVRPSTTLINDLVASADAVLETEPQVYWAVYSPTTDAQGGTLADSMTIVTNGWVDNAFDTQRRRGAAATSRSTFLQN